MAITAAIIAAVVFIVNQPSAVAGGVTSVTLTGAVDRPGPDGRPAGARLRRDDGRRPDRPA